MIPALAAARILNEMETTQRAFLYSKELHRREVRAGTIGLMMRLLLQAAVIANRDDIYLFAGYALE